MYSEQLNTVLSRFNPQQVEAISKTDGPQLIIAGAGSGKTSVLTAKIAVLMENGVTPESILALTFTRKAAGEMKERLVNIEGETAKRIVMGTFHSVFIRFLRPYADCIGFPSNFTILDEDDSQKCLKHCIESVIAKGFPPEEERTIVQTDTINKLMKKYDTSEIGKRISILKNNLINPFIYNKHPALAEERQNDMIAGRPLFGEIYMTYCDTCFRTATFDFDDILLYTHAMMQKLPEVRKAIASQFRYILVDEYQDTNTAQYTILRYLTEDNNNICVVGDDSQSIYAFRGAKIENIFRFGRENAGCNTYKLETNYRSTSDIVNTANRLISHNQNRIKKTCVSAEDKKGRIFVRSIYNERAESYYIAAYIRNMIKDHPELSYKDFAILYRTRSQSRAIEEALVKKNVPFVVFSGASFFERKEVKDLLAYFRLAMNPHDDEAFLRVVNNPVRRVGQASVAKLREFADRFAVSLWKATELPEYEQAGIIPIAREGIKKFKTDILNCQEIARTQSAHAAASAILALTGFYESYMAVGDAENNDRANNLMEIIESVKSYEEDIQEENRLNAGTDECKQSNLIDYLSDIMLVSNADIKSKEDNAVSLMTVHCSKGLEFECVIIAGADQGIFPLQNDFYSDIEEERRLFYVALTRAKSNLLITTVESRASHGKRKKRKPSQFISEINYKIFKEPS